MLYARLKAVLFYGVRRVLAEAVKPQLSRPNLRKEREGWGTHLSVIQPFPQAVKAFYGCAGIDSNYESFCG